MAFTFALLCVLLTFQTECGRQAESKPAEKKMKHMETNNLPKLEVNIENTGTTLNVEYKVKNTTDRVIYLFNVLTKLGSKDRLSDAPLYSSLRNDGTLVLAKFIPPVPKIKLVEFRQIPFTTKLEAGKEFAEKISLPIPIDENNPYFAMLPNSKTELKTAESVVFIVQFMREREGLEVKEAEIPSSFKVWHQDLFGNVETLSTNPRPTELQVNRRTDTFERF